ncbi:nucleoside kinase [Clostridiaceae bacterium M8S5]|nr:nucleoside kinase [Clostridiaceae bacterium M8S5]
MQTVNITEVGKIKIEKGTSIYDILVKHNIEKKYLCAKIKNDIKHMNYEITEDCDIELLDIEDKDGFRVYQRTLSFIFIKACIDIFAECKVSIEHSLNKGKYVEISKDSPLTASDVDKIKARIKEIIDMNLKIERKLIDLQKADAIFKKQGYTDKLRLSKYRKQDKMHVYILDGLYDKFYGYLAPLTGCIHSFDLKYFGPGVIIQFPRKENNFKIPKYEEHKKLAKIFKETEDWAEILDIGYVGALNDKISEGLSGEIVRIAEALHEKKIAYIADQICEKKSVKLILIAGPSSSGKTTFAQRLYTQLRVNEKRPVSISLDNYFVNRVDTPKDKNGNYDFESIDAIDIVKFNEDLLNLMNGKEVELPIFNFKTGKREKEGIKLQIDESQIIIIEGIHGLNEKLTSMIPHEKKFKIYISALTQLNIDNHNRIPTTDTRLIRRMVRDYKYRGNSAQRTLDLWTNVRNGEERNIFPYQEEADAMFNSALVYELSVLKKHAKPLLREIHQNSEHYSESKRLLKFLDYFKEIRDESIIPNTSIIKEFIGGSCYREE